MIIATISKSISSCMPTGCIYQYIKHFAKKNNNTSSFLVSWRYDHAFLSVSILLVADRMVTNYINMETCYFYFVFFLIQISRCIEIPFGFFADMMEKIMDSSTKPADTAAKEMGNSIDDIGKRMALTIIVYFELILNYALIYSILPPNEWNCNKTLSMLDSLYYSVITTATIGYGDIHPVGNISKILAMLQVLTSFVLIALSFAIYATNKNSTSKE